MKLSQLLFLALASYERFGDIDCYLDLDEDEYVEELSGIVFDPREKILLLTVYETEPVRQTPSLRLVKS